MKEGGGEDDKEEADSEDLHSRVSGILANERARVT